MQRFLSGGMANAYFPVKHYLSSVLCRVPHIKTNRWFIFLARLGDKYDAWQRDRGARAQERVQGAVNGLAILQSFTGHFLLWGQK